MTHLKDKISQINPKAGERIFVFRGYRDQFAYAVQLASDFYLMPCRFEPCGLTQMEAMAKGALPVAMSTGGLVDTVDDGIEILTGMPAGKPNKNGEYPKGTVNYAVQKGLEHYYKCYVRYARETHGCLGK